MSADLSAGLETFAKVRALHDRTTSPGEKAAAAVKMQTLARKAGLSVAEAVSRLDAPTPRTPAQAAADAFDDFFNTPEMRAQRAERERERAARRAELLRRYGSEEAVFADTPVEAALRAACAPLLGPGQDWDGIYHLDGWGMLDSRAAMPESVRRAVSRCWPLPATVAAAWAEYEAAETILDARCDFCTEYTPHAFVEARRCLVEDRLNTLPARSLADLRARGAWLAFWATNEISQGADDHRTLVSTLRADIERMGRRLREQDAAAPVQDGHATATVRPDPAPVHSGQGDGHPPGGYPSRRTNADKRRDVLALVGLGLTDREIARRAGVSPTTAGTIRRAHP